MEAAAAWCSTVLMVPLLKENPSPLVNATCGLVKGTGGWREGLVWRHGLQEGRPIISLPKCPMF